MSKATLVIMAAGIGSRFGGGIKQLEPFGPNGEIIMDYSIYDAIAAGFDEVVFVIRRDLEADFKDIIGKRIEQVVSVKYAFQETDNIPAAFSAQYQDRKKPWGTGQAILACKDIVKNPFLVINADDYYGKEAYQKAFDFLTSEKEVAYDACMIGFILGKTLSDSGAVTRGICQVNGQGDLTKIVETSNIYKEGDKAVVIEGENRQEVAMDGVVSMNMWGLRQEFFEILETGFEQFLAAIKNDYQKGEYLLPTIIGDLLDSGAYRVAVRPSQDKWFGVTYQEDIPVVKAAFDELITNGAYPERLF